MVATDDIKSNCGKELILKSMTNHYKTLLNIKPSIKIDKPIIIAEKHCKKISKLSIYIFTENIIFNNLNNIDRNTIVFPYKSLFYIIKNKFNLFLNLFD